MSRKGRQNPSFPCMWWLLSSLPLPVGASPYWFLLWGVSLSPWCRWSQTPLLPPPLPRDVEPSLLLHYGGITSCLPQSLCLHPFLLQAILRLPIKWFTSKILWFSLKRGEGERWSKELDSMISSSARIIAFNHFTTKIQEHRETVPLKVAEWNLTLDLTHWKLMLFTVLQGLPSSYPGDTCYALQWQFFIILISR